MLSWWYSVICRRKKGRVRSWYFCRFREHARVGRLCTFSKCRKELYLQKHKNSTKPEKRWKEELGTTWKLLASSSAAETRIAKKETACTFLHVLLLSLLFFFSLAKMCEKKERNNPDCSPRRRGRKKYLPHPPPPPQSPRFVFRTRLLLLLLLRRKVNWLLPPPPLFHQAKMWEIFSCEKIVRKSLLRMSNFFPYHITLCLYFSVPSHHAQKKFLQILRHLLYHKGFCGKYEGIPYIQL